MVSEAINENAWIADIAGELSVESCVQCMRLWEAVENVERDVTTPDRIS
jgi:hypothetical protein